MQKFRAKFKGSSKTWIHIAKVYYELKRFEEARKLKERALKSTSDKKQRKCFNFLLFVITLHLHFFHRH